jgi:hypothetical protein
LLDNSIFCTHLAILACGIIHVWCSPFWFHCIDTVRHTGAEAWILLEATCLCVFVCWGIKSYWFPCFLWCDWKILCFYNHSLNLCTLLLLHKLCNMRKLKGSYISVLSSSCGSTLKKPCSMVKCL